MLTAELQRMSSLSFSTLSGGVCGDLPDEPAGITRSSLTQGSCQNDTCSHTWGSSLTGSLKAHRQYPPTWSQFTPREAPTRLQGCDAHVAAVLQPPAQLETPMDEFDLALALDVQQRQSRHSNERRQQHFSPCCSKTFLVPVPDNSLEEKPAVQTTAALSATKCVSPLDKAIPIMEKEHRYSRVNRGCQAAPPLFTFSPLSSTSTDLNSSGCTTTIISSRQAQLRHLEQLLKETRNLHEALWKQLQDLKRQEEKEVQRCSSKRSLHTT